MRIHGWAQHRAFFLPLQLQQNDSLAAFSESKAKAVLNPQFFAGSTKFELKNYDE
jgi:hypothetical protein